MRATSVPLALCASGLPLELDQIEAFSFLQHSNDRQLTKSNAQNSSVDFSFLQLSEGFHLALRLGGLALLAEEIRQAKMSLRRELAFIFSSDLPLPPLLG